MNQQTPPDDLSAPDGQRVAAALDRWKRKLLDLSKRNRALNFRPYKVSTVAIVDEPPAEVFRQLYLLERSLRFKPAPEPAPGNEPGRAEEELARERPVFFLTEEGEIVVEPDELEVQGSSLDFTTYDDARLDPRHTDDVLQTASPLEQLQKSLRRLEEQARGAIEEQGVNPLFLALGMLHYKRDNEEAVLRAPLVLVPVTLGRRSVEAGYTLHAADDDPIVNPALAEYLRQRGITLPELPDPADIAADYDLQTLFRAATEAIAEQPGWTLKTDVFLGLFSFQKFVMYKDLEANGAAFASHRLIRRLVTRSGNPSMGTVVGLPEEVRDLDLDAGFPPEATAQVVDADSSQLRAMAAVQREHDMVLEGPPGTGKSQTITNLIAQALSAGKSVLFVAEKMAALQVVHGRLVSAGLGELCLELHSTRANKRTVIRELAAALDASLQRPQMPGPSGPRLQAVRRELDAYVEAVHTPWGALGITPYRAYGELGTVLGAPKLRLTAPVETVTREQLADAARDLASLAELAKDLGDPTTHPWRETTRTFYSEGDLDDLAALLADLAARLVALLPRAEEAQQAFALPPVRTFADAETAAALAGVLGRSPGAPLEVLRSDAWNTPPPQAVEIAARGRRIAQLRERLEGRLAAEALERDHTDDIAYIERKEAGALRFLNVLSGRFREIRRRWTGWRQPGWQPTLAEQAAEMRQVDVLRRERQTLAGEDAAARQLFGPHWQGEASAWDALDAYIRWVVEIRSLVRQHGLDERFLEIAAHPRPDVSLVETLRREAVEAAGRLAELQTAVGWPPNHLAAAPFGEILERVRSLAENLRLAPRWAAFESVRARAAAGPSAEVVAAALRGEVPFPALAAAFLRAFYQRWLSAVVQEREPLRSFHALAHEQRVAEFRRLDQQVLQENRARLVRDLRDRAQKRLQSPAVLAGMPILRREMTKQRALAPLRKTLRNAEAAIRAIKPCFMMSPLTVAQLLDGKAPHFDLVVFDEASQLPAEDAVGAIVRGQQLVVVGDPKQLPPTDFFSVMAGQVNAALDEDGMPLYEDSESILEEFMGAGVPHTSLRWHYRSTHESLITFSNVSFYDGGLFTFPSTETDSHARGVRFEYVEDGVYEGKGVNLVEARRVADAVMRHARETPELSLGVGTFSLRQQLAILDELEARRRQDPGAEAFFAPKEEGGFFVKNLENIQGDERDVIFLSVTYGRGPDGKIRHHFGPINGENGWRRLNVLTTRARRHMRVFSSMRGDEIHAAQTPSRGAKLLRDFLLYAEHGRLDVPVAWAAGSDEERLLEQDVHSELTRHGIRLQPRVGMAGYRIDFGVLDDAAPGRFLCGIECDGPSYRDAETVRDRDRLRQEVLEARGWTLLRVWSTDWFKDRPGQVERLLRQIEEARQRGGDESLAKGPFPLGGGGLEQGEGQDGGGPSKGNLSGGRPHLAPPPVPTLPLPTAIGQGSENRYAGLPAESIPPEAYQKMILDVLRQAGSLERSELIKEVRALLGYKRTGAKLEKAIGAVIDDLVAREILGEGSSGLRLRE